MFCHFVTFSVAPIISQVLGVFSLVIWTTGAGVDTFRSPFTATGNGYFASWLAFAASLFFVHLTVPKVDQMFKYVAKKAMAQETDQQIALIIFVSSIIELVAAATICDTTRRCENQLGWAVAVGTISLAICSLYIALWKILQRFRLVFAVILLFLWIPGCGVLTFDTPFVVTGNGYFSAWVAFFYSAYWTVLLSSNFRRTRQAAVPSAPAVPPT